jgi:serine/threonine-protein kinase RsbW
MDAGSRDVSLTIPAKPGYLVLARLALAAVCRLTSLGPAEVADLKLAVTEAAGEFIDDSETEEGEAQVDLVFRLEDDRIVLELSGPSSAVSEMEFELGRAIIEATVDESTFESGRTTLVKRL